MTLINDSLIAVQVCCHCCSFEKRRMQLLRITEVYFEGFCFYPKAVFKRGQAKLGPWTNHYHKVFQSICSVAGIEIYYFFLFSVHSFRIPYWYKITSDRVILKQIKM